MQPLLHLASAFLPKLGPVFCSRRYGRRAASWAHVLSKVDSYAGRAAIGSAPKKSKATALGIYARACESFASEGKEVPCRNRSTNVEIRRRPSTGLTSKK